MTPHHPALEYLIAVDERAHHRPDTGLRPPNAGNPQARPASKNDAANLLPGPQPGPQQPGPQRAAKSPLTLHCPQCAAVVER